MSVFSATPPVPLPASHDLFAPSKPSTKSFTICTCKTVSKQSTLTPFRINTYKKHPGYPPSLRDLTRSLPQSSRSLHPLPEVAPFASLHAVPPLCVRRLSRSARGDGVYPDLVGVAIPPSSPLSFPALTTLHSSAKVPRMAKPKK